MRFVFCSSPHTCFLRGSPSSGGHYAEVVVAAMAFPASAAVMGDKTSSIKSPGSALRLPFGSQPTVPFVPPLQPCPIVAFLLDPSQDLPIIIAPRGR